jgi:hypothetical protein
MNLRLLRVFGGTIGNDYAWELDLFYKLRDFKDGISFFELVVNWDKYMGDHNPQFTFSLMLFNFKIWEFIIYNVWHIDNPNSPYYEENLIEEEDERLEKLSELSERDGPNYETDQG